MLKNGCSNIIYLKKKYKTMYYVKEKIMNYSPSKIVFNKMYKKNKLKLKK